MVAALLLILASVSFSATIHTKIAEELHCSCKPAQTVCHRHVTLRCLTTTDRGSPSSVHIHSDNKRKAYGLGLFCPSRGGFDVVCCGGTALT